MTIINQNALPSTNHFNHLIAAAIAAKSNEVETESQRLNQTEQISLQTPLIQKTKNSTKRTFEEMSETSEIATSPTMSPSTPISNLINKENKYITCKKLMTLNPDNNLDWNTKTYLLIQLKKFNETLTACNQAIEFDSMNNIAWNRKGYALYQLQRYDEALIAFENALILNPSISEHWKNKGHTLTQLERFEKAIKAYDKALQLDPNNGRIWLNKSQIFFHLKLFRQSLTACQKALELDPNLDTAKNLKNASILLLKAEIEAMKTLL